MNFILFFLLKINKTVFFSRSILNFKRKIIYKICGVYNNLFYAKIK